MKIRKSLAALALAGVLSSTAACGAGATTASTTSTTATTAATSAAVTTSTAPTGPTAPAAAAPAGAAPAGAGRGPGAGVDVASVSTQADLVALVQAAYGEAQLGLQRGHEPVQAVLTAVLAISHDELHVRMEEQGQNLAAVATDLGIAPQTLVDALVASWSPAIDRLLADGTITQAQADGYRAALEEAFTFRVTWDGQAATPTFAGIAA